VIYAQEKYSSVWSDLISLARKNQIESGIPGEELDLDFETYENLNESDIAVLYTMRTKSGALVGYSSFFFIRSLHSKSKIQAIQDAFYVLSQYRGITSIKFFRFVEDQLRSKANLILRQSTESSDWSRTLIRSGYVKQETLFIKNL